jgi:L-cysteine desulfidase
MMQMIRWFSFFAILSAVQAQSFDYVISSAESVVLMDAKTAIPNIGQLWYGGMKTTMMFHANRRSPHFLHSDRIYG